MQLHFVSLAWNSSRLQRHHGNASTIVFHVRQYNRLRGELQQLLCVMVLQPNANATIGHLAKIMYFLFVVLCMRSGPRCSHTDRHPGRVDRKQLSDPRTKDSGLHRPPSQTEVLLAASSHHHHHHHHLSPHHHHPTPRDGNLHSLSLFLSFSLSLFLSLSLSLCFSLSLSLLRTCIKPGTGNEGRQSGWTMEQASPCTDKEQIYILHTVEQW